MKTELFRNENCLFLLKTLLIVNFQLLIACALCAQNGITLSGFSADVGSGGAATTLTFNVGWDKNAANMPAIWSDTAWVFADFNNAGTMTRLPLASGATLTAHSADAAATYVSVRQIDGNPHGVWVVGNAKDVANNTGAFSATVQLYTAATATADFPGLCVYAINYPPRGQYTDVDSIKFNGTPDFTVWLAHKNETGISSTVTWSRAQSGAGAYPVPAGSYVHSFTDASRAPGTLLCKMPAINVQPQSQVLCGYNVTLSLTVEADAGSGSLSTYRWIRDGDTVATTTSGLYSAVVSTGAVYTVEVTNSHGCSVISDPAVVRVGGAETGAIGGLTACADSPGSIGSSALLSCSDTPGGIGSVLTCADSPGAIGQ